MVENGSEVWRSYVRPDVVVENESRMPIGVPYGIVPKLGSALKAVQENRGLRPNTFFQTQQEEDAVRVTAIGEVHTDIVEFLDTGAINLDPNLDQREVDIDYLRGIRI